MQAPLRYSPNPLLNVHKHAAILLRWAGGVQKAVNYLTWVMPSCDRAEWPRLRLVLRILLGERTELCRRNQWMFMMIHWHGNLIIVFHGPVTFAVDDRWQQFSRIVMTAMRMRCHIGMTGVGDTLKRITVQWCHDVGKLEVH
jgi:hypothetical protein